MTQKSGGRMYLEPASDMRSVVAFADEYRTLGAVRKALVLSGAEPRNLHGGLRVGQDRLRQLLTAASDFELVMRAGAKRFVHNRLNLKSRHERALAELRRLTEVGPEAAAIALRDISGLERLDDHQVVNVAAMAIPEASGLCIFDEQGTGKTVVTIYGWDALAVRGVVDFLLVLAPKSMVPEWVRDFVRFKGDFYEVGAVTGSRRKKRASLRKRWDVLVTNYESAVSLEAELAARLRLHGGKAMLVVDESFFAKNFDAERTRAIRRLREECDRGYVLCGTPAPNSAHDVIEQFNIADFGATFAGVDVPQDREAALPVVRRVLEARGLYVRNRKREVLPHLPGRRHTKVGLRMQPQQRRAYMAALDDLILDLRRISDRDFGRRIPSILARRSALLQICASPRSVIPGYSERPAKLLALEEILEDAVGSRGEKVVVWSFFTDSVDDIVRRFERFGPVRYDGTVADTAARREAVRRFQEDDETMIFVGNPAAAGAGLTLHRSRIAVYYSLSTQAAHFLQSLDRIHRRGQEREVDYLYLICDGSIEAQEYGRIAAKKAAARDLLSDGADPSPTREMLLDDALDLKRLLDQA